MMLNAKDVGARLKKLREARELSMRAVAIKAGVAVSFLSKIEAGKGSPTLATLIKLLAALDVTPTEFLSESDERSGPALVFSGRDMKVLDDGDKMWRYIFPGNPHVKMGMTYEEYRPFTHHIENERHSCDIGGYVLEGELTLQLSGGPKMKIESGDAFYIPAGTLHRAANLGEVPVRMVVVELKHTCAKPLKRGSR